MQSSNHIKLPIVLLLLLPLFMNSCVVNYYKAGRKNVPGLEQKGDLKAGVSMNTKSASNLLTSSESSNSGNRIDASIAYSPINNLGISVNTNSNILSIDYLLFGLESPISLSRFYEFHAGYYGNIKDDMLFEAYAFGALGHIRPLADNLFENVSQNRFGVNSGIWWKVKNWRFGLHTGFSRHSFSNQLFDEEIELVNASIFNSVSLTSLYAEHALTVKYIIKDVELEAQFGRVNRIRNGSEGATYAYNRKNFSLGLLYNLNSVFNKKLKKTIEDK